MEQDEKCHIGLLVMCVQIIDNNVANGREKNADTLLVQNKSLFMAGS